MSAPDPITHARALFEIAHGRPPRDTDAAWAPFFDAVREMLTRTHNYAIVEARVAILEYQPIDVRDMRPTYARAFTTTRDGCAAAVLALKDLRCRAHDG